jgi:ubiquinone/menaquinone biosynthesis C-methylase UbiE
MQKADPNDKTAYLYDLMSKPLKNEELLSQELKLIQNLTPKLAIILDIGCGTGRHLLPLTKMGYKVTGIDPSKGMLKALIEKDPNADIVNTDFLELPESKVKYNLIIMMWNTFNEIALTRAQALKLLEKCSRVLAPRGMILINIDDRSALGLPGIDFEYDFRDQNSGLNYHYIWKVLKYYPRIHKTVSEERIISDKINIATRITQRWWSLDEVQDLALSRGFTISNHHVPANSELYLVLKHDQ